MNHPESLDLTSSEIGYLWTGYTINEMSEWVQQVFKEQAVDQDIKALFEHSLDITGQLLKDRKRLLKNAQFPIPEGFSQSDIHPQAPRLFTDRFMAHYLHIGTQHGLVFHAKAMSASARTDVRSNMTDSLSSTMQLNERVISLLLAKGLYQRTPSIPIPDVHERIQKTSYLSGWFGDTRPMNSMEMANLYTTLDLIALVEALSMGFAQTTDQESTKQLLLEAERSAKSQFRRLSQLLEEENLPIPMTYIGEITDSQARIFSDRLMLSHIAGLFGSMITQYGYSVGAVMKHDLMTSYLATIGEAGAFTEKVTKHLIEQEWLEKTPGAVDRRQLVRT